MSVKLKKVADQVVVITGASSGIGLVTARMFARKGARVVVSSRDGDALAKLENEINSGGGQALAVACDVTSFDQVRQLADASISRFGRIDTWVNDAGGSVYGRILDVPVEEERKLFELNFWGMVYGSKVAAEHLRVGGGALINVGSVASDRAIPLQGAYGASKHAVKAYTDTLRSELEEEHAPVSVTLIKPTAIATPFFKHAKTYMDAQPTEPSPMYAPETVAEAIVYAAENPVRDLLIGDIAPLQSALGNIAPRTGDKVMGAMMFEGQMDRERVPEPGDNKIFDRPDGKLRERGEYGTFVMENSAYTKAAMHPMLTGMLAAASALAIGFAVSGVRFQKKN